MVQHIILFQKLINCLIPFMHTSKVSEIRAKVIHYISSGSGKIYEKEETLLLAIITVGLAKMTK